MTPRAVTPDAPPIGDSLRLVRTRLYLTIAVAAVLPMALGAVLLRVLAVGTGPELAVPARTVEAISAGSSR